MVITLCCVLCQSLLIEPLRRAAAHRYSVAPSDEQGFFSQSPEDALRLSKVHARIRQAGEFRQEGVCGRKNDGAGPGRAGRIQSLMPPPAGFTADVDAATGLCADGRVRIGPSPGKGLGAFAVVSLSPSVPSSSDGLVRGEHQIGEYRGEVYTLDGMQARYGKKGVIAALDATWHKQWSTARRARGVDITGNYVFTVSDALDPWSEVLYVDAEDCACAVWTRYINHSAEHPNLSVRSSNGLTDARTTLRLVITRDIDVGEELLIDYGPSYDFGESPALEV